MSNARSRIDRSPLHRLTRGQRGWYRHIPGVGTKYIASVGDAPTGEIADEIFIKRFPDLARQTAKTRRRSIKDAADRYIDARRGAVLADTIGDYTRTLQEFCDALGHDTPLASIGPAHFNAVWRHVVKHKGLARRDKFVSWIRTFFNWCKESGLIGDTPRYGPEFKQPTKKARRLHKKAVGKRLYTREQIVALLIHADVQMRACILLALNGGFGNLELGQLQRDEIDGDTIRQIRGKTGADRVVPLWRDTQRAVAALPTHASGLVFESSRGFPYVHHNHDNIADGFPGLCVAAGVPDMGFYSIRRTFRTIADRHGDRRAVETVMGHTTDSDTGDIYVQEVTRDRLVQVVVLVRRWLGSLRAVPGLRDAVSRSSAASGSPRSP